VKRSGGGGESLEAAESIFQQGESLAVAVGKISRQRGKTAADNNREHAAAVNSAEPPVYAGGLRFLLSSDQSL
jgi:hypothetical protein